MDFRVMSYNIRSGRSNFTPMVHDYTLACEVIKRYAPMIVGLNEVGNKPPEAQNYPQAQFMGERLGMEWFFAPAVNFNGYDYGNALLSAFPIIEAGVVPIPDPPRTEKGYYETRCILEARLDVPGFEGGVTVLVSHFGLMSGEQKNAVATLKGILERTKTPVIFMGDLNMTPDNPLMQEVFELLEDVSEKSLKPLTFPSESPERKIDYIFTTKNFKAKNIIAPHHLESDHYPIIADLFT